MKNFCHTVSLCYFLSPFNTSSAQLIYIQGDVVNIRSAASTSGTVVVKAKRLDELTLVRRDKLDVVNGMEDYWYVVRTPAGKEGFVFGHFTSWKREGQETV
ncbi:MAG: SH3 domain-containing protein, partial [Flavobacteriales bacterium]